MGSTNWSTLPLLPLKCVLEHLNLKDTLAATSTCHNWRHGLYLYDGYKEPLKLKVKQRHKSIFLTRIFRKKTKRLHIYVDGCGDENDNFLQTILPKFYETELLREVIFIGPSYLKIGQHNSIIKLRRTVTENLIHAHRYTLQNLAMYGCEIAPPKNVCIDDNEIEGRGLSFINVALSGLLLAKCNIRALGFSALQHLSLDYDSVDSLTLECLSRLPQLTLLSLTILKSWRYSTPQWTLLENSAATKHTNVELNIIDIPPERFSDVIQYVLVEDLPLVAIRVLFCKILHKPLLLHLSQMYCSSLREMQWIDAPFVADCKRTYPNIEPNDTCAINPFILLCWKCTDLQKIVIHGYWIWQYDILGIVRLRSTSLQHLEISAPSRKEKEHLTSYVTVHDRPRPVGYDFIQEVNKYIQFKWNPNKSPTLHHALGYNSNENHRLEYLVNRVLLPLDNV